MARVKIQPRNPFIKYVPLEVMRNRIRLPPAAPVKKKKKRKARPWTHKKCKKSKKQVHEKHVDATKTTTAQCKNVRLTDTVACCIE